MVLKPKAFETEYERYKREKEQIRNKENRLKKRAERNNFRGTISAYSK